MRFQDRIQSARADETAVDPTETSAAGPVQDHEGDTDVPADDPNILPGVPWSVCWRIYLSHFLSTWNSRSFEFAAVLFLSAIYPNTLLELSIYALVTSASAIIFATPAGHAIDRRGRLPVVRFSIVAGRIAVALSCLGFWGLYNYPFFARSLTQGIFAVLILLSCLEKVASVINLVAVERDWVVVLADQNEPVLRKINARMRRIDLTCKLVGPLFISLVDGASVQVAILLTLGLNVVSLPIEYFAIAQVYKRNPALHTRQNDAVAEVPSRITIEPQPPRSYRWLRWFRSFTDSYKSYFKHPASPPSFALALLYLTVLSFGGQMVTYMLASGYNTFYIGLVRSLSVVFEISATWIAPRMMTKIGPVRSGMWLLSWQMLWLGGTVSFFWGEPTPIVAASGLAAGTILSRIGLWGYDLCAQVIIQTEVVESHRGSFSSTEASFQNFFELISYALTIAFSRPNQFKYPVLVSAVAVYSAGCLFAWFVRRRRGHLVHVPCAKTRRATPE